MASYHGAFSEAEVGVWLDRQEQRYISDGFGLWGVRLHGGEEIIGQCGLTVQEIGGEQVVEVGYLFNRDYWHQGFAVEAADAAVDFAFTSLGATDVYAQMGDTNLASMNVAIRLGMTARIRFSKHYRGVDMTLYGFAISRSTWGARRSATLTS